MRVKETSNDSLESVKKALRTHIKMCQILLEELDITDIECREGAHYCAFIILQHVHVALKNINSDIPYPEASH